jgi:hypothetical protein
MTERSIPGGALYPLLPICFLSLSLSTLLHLVTFFRVSISSYWLAVMILSSSGILTVIFSIVTIKVIGRSNTLLRRGSAHLADLSANPNRIFPGLGMWADWFLWIQVGYVFCFWLWFVMQADGGSELEIVDGQDVLRYRDTIIKILTPRELADHQNYIARGLTAVWMVMSWFFMLRIFSEIRSRTNVEPAITG